MYAEVLLSEREPEIGVWVTTIDTAGEHRVYRRTEHGWNMRDAAGTNSPNDNLALVSWLEKIDFESMVSEGNWSQPHIGFAEPTPLSNVAEFHRTFNHPIGEHPTIPSPNRAQLRVDLIQEELNELREAIEKGDVVEAADAFCDMQYVLSGAILEFGMADRFRAMFEEVHRSNMSKACDNLQQVTETMDNYRDLGTESYHQKVGDKLVVYRVSDNKILKNKFYSPADLKSILNQG